MAEVKNSSLEDISAFWQGEKIKEVEKYTTECSWGTDFLETAYRNTHLNIRRWI